MKRHVLRTEAGLFVRLELHEVRAGAGEGLVVVDEAQVSAGPSATISSAWVWSCGGQRDGERD